MLILALSSRKRVKLDLHFEVVGQLQGLIDGFQARALFKPDASSQFCFVEIFSTKRESDAIIDR